MDSAIGGRVLKFTNLLWHPRKISKPKASKSDTSRPASPPSTSTGRATRPWERNDRNARTRLQGYQRPRLSDTFSSHRPHGSRLVGGSSLHWCQHSRSLARVNGRSSHRPPRHFRSLLTTKQMISACNPLSHYWTETLSKRPYLVAQKWILVGLQILGDLAQSNQFFFAPPPPPITMSIVLSVWESIQLTMKHTMQRILGLLRRHLDGEGWRQPDGDAAT